MGKASQVKGSGGERDLAKILTKIFNGSFIRSPASGGFIGGKNFIRKAHMSEGQIRDRKGDLVPPDFMTKFVIEVKNYEEFRFHQLLTPNPCPQLDIWIKQALDCIDTDDVWFVAFKITRLGWYVTIPDQNQGYAYKNHCVYRGHYGCFYVTGLIDFFQENCDLIKQYSF